MFYVYVIMYVAHQSKKSKKENRDVDEDDRHWKRDFKSLQIIIVYITTPFGLFKKLIFFYYRREGVRK